MFSIATEESNSSEYMVPVMFGPENWCAEALLPLDPKTLLFPTLLTDSPCSPKARASSSFFLWINSSNKKDKYKITNKLS